MGNPVKILTRKEASMLTQKHIVIPDGYTEIEENVFRKHKNILSVSIPDSVTCIDEKAFAGCKSLIDISVDANNPNFSSEAGVLFSKDKATLSRCPEGKTGSYSIPGSVTKIGKGGFFYCELLTNVLIPTSVTDIDNHAFSHCKSLTTVSIPDNVTSIGDYTFNRCTGLTSIVIPDGVMSINGNTFCYCESLKNVTIGNGVSIIGCKLFEDCTELTDIFVNGNNTIYSSLDGVLFNKDKTTLILFPSGKTGLYRVCL